ncbi:MAG: O-antigen ligase family protein [Candidatus Promineifilaceae bacterium]
MSEDSRKQVQAVLSVLQDSTWILLLILTPLWINLWGQQPFEYSKVMLARSLIWLLVALAVAQFLFNLRIPVRELPARRVLVPAGLLALIIVLATVLGSDWRLSLWGSYERAQGALTQLSYLTLFVLAAVQFRRLARARLLLAVMALTAVILIMIGMAQFGGWQAFGLSSDARSPLFATLGRANFLGAYLAILLPLTLAQLQTARRPNIRFLWAVLFAAELVVIGLTSARAAWLGTAVALAVYALLQCGPRLARGVRLAAWSGVALLFLSGPLAVVALSGRLLGSTAARLAIWQRTADLIRQRPLLGYGPDALGLVFPRVFPPQLVYYQGREFFVDRAHNLFLDWAVTAGIPGLLAFLLLLVVFVLSVRRGLLRTHTGRKRIMLIAILSAVLGNMGNNMVSFDVTPTAVAAWLLMGMGVALALPPALLRKKPAPATTRPVIAGPLFAGMLILILALAVWQFNARPLLADSAARFAYRYGLLGDWESANAAAERAVGWWPVEPAHQLLLSQTSQRLARQGSASSVVSMRQAEAALLAAREARPDDWLIWLASARFYGSAGRISGRDTAALMHEAYRRAAALAPNTAAVYTEWGRAYLEEDDAQSAVPLLRRAVDLDASSDQASVYLKTAEQALRDGYGWE